MNKKDTAITCFNEAFNCSQAVLATFSEEFGLDKEISLKIASSFGAGMGRMANTCGAVTGAYMVLGLKYGKYLCDDNTSKEKNYKLVQDFTKRFNEKNGSIQCKELLKYDISTPDGMKQATEKGLFNTLCVKYVEDAVEILEEMLNNE